ncbi:MAG: hypothetical protein LIP06_00990 [Tannerellaceae bacterium]|nr:hypothetical protein [Tannerellaceae bacterium]
MVIRIITILYFFSFFFWEAGYAADKSSEEAVMLPFRYTPHSISQTKLAGIHLSKGVNAGMVVEVGSILMGNVSSIPLDFIINLSAVNPNIKKITLSELDYILKIDNVEFSRGKVSKKYKFAASSSGRVLLPVHLNVASLLKGERSGIVQNLVKNFMGTGNRPSHITLYLKPTYRVGRETITLSDHVPVIFSFQGNR